MTSLAYAYIKAGKQNAKNHHYSDIFYKENLGDKNLNPKMTLTLVYAYTWLSFNRIPYYSFKSHPQ